MDLELLLYKFMEYEQLFGCLPAYVVDTLASLFNSHPHRVAFVEQVLIQAAFAFAGLVKDIVKMAVVFIRFGSCDRDGFRALQDTYSAATFTFRFLRGGIIAQQNSAFRKIPGTRDSFPAAGE